MSGQTTNTDQIITNAPSSPVPGPFTLQLGSIIFDEAQLEVPEEISNLGGSYVIEQHDFPGGTRTQQTYGAFPDEIGWKGHFSGPNALSRAIAVDQIRVAGQAVNLVYGPKTFLGRVTQFTLSPKHQWFINYQIKFLPISDTSAPSGPLPTPEEQLSDQMDDLDTAASGDPFPLPDALVDPVSALMDTVNGALQAAGGIVANIANAGIAAINTAVGAVTSVAQGIINTANAAVQGVVGAVQGVVNTVTGAVQGVIGAVQGVVNTVANAASYMASTVSNIANTISNIVTAPLAAVGSVLQSINPNLPQLAAQYLGDATQWPRIAAANNMNPPDPQPTGSFTLTIPIKLTA